MTCRTHDTMAVKLLIVAVTVAWILGEVNCSGQSRTARHIPANSKFPACQPGERFAKKMSRRHLTEANEVFTFKNRKGEERFYICQRCSMCGDGIKQTEHCYEDKDTQCGGCINPEHLYDNATKSCQPKSVIFGTRVDDIPEVNTPVQEAVGKQTEPGKTSSAVLNAGEVAPMRISDGDDRVDQFDNNKNGIPLPVKGDNVGDVHRPAPPGDTNRSTLVPVVVVFSVIVVVLIALIIGVAFVCLRSNSKDEESPVEV